MALNIIVTGSASGLGRAIVDALLDAGQTVYQYDHAGGEDVLTPEDYFAFHTRFGTRFDVLINCAGVNKINWLADVSEEEWDKVIDVNLKGIFKMTQGALPFLKKSKGTVINIVSNAAHMPMRCSAAYNASKGGALILTKQLARELSADGITVFSISPNRLAGTAMSESIDEQVVATRGWTLEEAQRYQRQSLLAGEETPPERVAEFIAFLLQSKEHHKYLTGCDIPYGA